MAVPPERDRRERASLLIVSRDAAALRVDGIELAHPIRLHATRHDLVDANAGRRQFHRERLGERRDGGPQHRREREVGDRLLDSGRRGHENRAAPAPRHRRHRRANHPDDAEQQLIGGRAPRTIVEGERRAGGWSAGVREQQVDAAEPRVGRLHPSGHVGGP
jgi:hypothetical protein